MEVIDKEKVKILQSKIVSKEEFDYDTMFARPLYSLLSQYDIDRLYNIATSIRYAGDAVKKKNAILDIMHNRGFIELSAGTNRLCFSFLEDPTICVKVAADRTGIKDNPREFLNQAYLKPFCTKVFEISPCGTVGLFERVKPIQNREEFYSVAGQIYELIDMLTSKYILADFGTHYFMNYGFREFHDFGPVILDFPYLYEADISKLVCKKPLTYPDGTVEMCGGLIDYDLGFNKLVCTKCGAEYRAVELAKYINDNLILQKGSKSMVEGIKVSLIKNGKVQKMYDTVMQEETPTIKSKKADGIVIKAVKVSAEEAAKPVTPEVKDIVKAPATDLGIKVSAKRVPVTNNFKSFNEKKRNKDKDHKSKGNNKPENKQNQQAKPAKKEAAPARPEVKLPKSNLEPEKVEPKEIFIEEGNWKVVEHDLEHHIIIFENEQGEGITMSTDIFTDEMLERLIPDWEDAKSAVEELQIAKMDVRKLEETIDKLKKENTDLKDKDRKSKKDAETTSDAYEKLLLEKVDFEDKVDELTNELEGLKEELEQTNNKLKEANSKATQFEEYVDQANEEIEELKTKVAAYEDADEVVEDEEAEESEYEEAEYSEGFGFSRLSGKLSTVGAIVKNTGMESIPDDCTEDDHVIVFEDGQGGYFTDQYGNVIIVSDINGKALANADLKIAPKKENNN